MYNPFDQISHTVGEMDPVVNTGKWQAERLTFANVTDNTAGNRVSVDPATLFYTFLCRKTWTVTTGVGFYYEAGLVEEDLKSTRSGVGIEEPRLSVRRGCAPHVESSRQTSVVFVGTAGETVIIVRQGWISYHESIGQSRCTDPIERCIPITRMTQKLSST